MQVALDAELHLAGTARPDGVAHVVARLRGHGQRQVAVHARGIGPLQGAREVQHSRQARARGRRGRVRRLPGKARLALGVGVGEAQVAGLHGDALALDLPAHGGGELLHWHHGVLEDAGQQQPAAGHGQRRAAARLRELELHVRARQAGHGGHAVLRGEGQPRHLAAQLVLPRLLQRPAPAGLQLLHHAPRGIGLQHAVHGLVQGQAAGDLRDRGQVQPVGAQLALLPARPALAGVAQEEVAAGPAQTVVGHELQVPGGQLEAIVQPAAADPTRHGPQQQGAQVRAQRGIDRAQRHVGRAAHDPALLHVHPGAQRAPALAHLQGSQVRVAVEPRDVHLREIGVHLATPALPVAAVRGEQRLAELPAQREALAPVGRRRRIQADAVAQGAVAQHQVHLGQRQRLGPAQRVAPAQSAAADRHLGLREQPVGGGAVGLASVAKAQAGDEDAAILLAAYVQLRPLYIDLLEPQAQQRARRQRYHHARQAQRLAALRVEQGHAGQLDGGKEPLAARRDGGNAHGNPQCPLGLGLQLGAEIADTRHNPAVQRPPGSRQQQPQGQQQPQPPSRTARHEPEKAGRMGRKLCHGE
ncbi:hypothetical protein ALISP_5365 [Alicycliphilus sp. B1]|nr:hypothetical protein ALISP_5365 [Alicycliphilus sp. B1]